MTDQPPSRPEADIPSDDRIKRIRRHRNLVVGGLLAGFVILVYFISIAKMT